MHLHLHYPPKPKSVCMTQQLWGSGWIKWPTMASPKTMNKTGVEWVDSFKYMVVNIHEGHQNAQ